MPVWLIRDENDQPHAAFRRLRPGCVVPRRRYHPRLEAATGDADHRRGLFLDCDETLPPRHIRGLTLRRPRATVRSDRDGALASGERELCVALRFAPGGSPEFLGTCDEGSAPWPVSFVRVRLRSAGDVRPGRRIAKDHVIRSELTTARSARCSEAPRAGRKPGTRPGESNCTSDCRPHVLIELNAESTRVAEDVAVFRARPGNLRVFNASARRGAHLRDEPPVRCVKIESLALLLLHMSRTCVTLSKREVK